MELQFGIEEHLEYVKDLFRKIEIIKNRKYKYKI